MNVLLTGATGFVGGHILRYLTESNVKMSVLGRAIPSAFPKESFFCAAIDNTTNYSLAIKGVDVIVHSAARAHIMNDLSLDPLEEFRKVNTKGTMNLAKQAAEAGVKRFIFISSIKVNGEMTSSKTPFTSSDPRLPEDAYGMSKSEAEEALLRLAFSSSMEVVIIRPPLVYGPGVKANFLSLLKMAALPIPLPFGNIKNNRRSLVSVFNLADLINVCLTHKNAVNKVIMVSDGRDVSTSELFFLLKAAFRKKNLSYSIPEGLFRFIGRVTRRSMLVERLCGSLCVDISDTKSSLNWEPPVSVEDGLLKTVDHFCSNK
jgi:nucleoside-diphosphate-sugar epimerase